MADQPQPEPVDQSEDALLARYLRDRDEACPRCGYNLRSLTGDRCPECGDRLRLRVGLVESRLGAYISAVAAGCLGFGGALFFLILVLIYAPPEYWRESASPWIMSGQLVLMGLVLGVLLIKRRGFAKHAYKAQVIQAVIVWVLAVGMSVLSLVFFED